MGDYFTKFTHLYVVDCFCLSGSSAQCQIVKDVMGLTWEGAEKSAPAGNRLFCLQSHPPPPPMDSCCKCWLVSAMVSKIVTIISLPEILISLPDFPILEHDTAWPNVKDNNRWNDHCGAEEYVNRNKAPQEMIIFPVKFLKKCHIFVHVMATRFNHWFDQDKILH